ncbi:unnamed protein product [Ceratitis capitata]|uniref:(Mediterranean fruit fly) hypothetical protein n=1 Tax=Ceratitis capitata TaxID=7213 RepID=A0A811UEE8_CERCA|nr:unnamed protein product [Ceratitis capitata]
MVSYYNPMTYSQKHSTSSLNYPPTQPWQWTANYPASANHHQLLNEMESPHSHHQVYYNTHHMFHPASSSTAEWHSPLSTTENILQSAPNVQQIINESNDGIGLGNNTSPDRSTNSTAASTVELTSANESRRGMNDHHIAESLPSPSLAISGSNASSPEVSITTASTQHPVNSTASNLSNYSSPVKTQYYEWMKKPSYPTQPAPAHLQIIADSNMQIWDRVMTIRILLTRGSTEVSDLSRSISVKFFATQAYILFMGVL